jgi:hypothetical protein
MEAKTTISDLQQLADCLVGQIDGGEECRGRDSLITGHIEAVDAAIRALTPNAAPAGSVKHERQGWAFMELDTDWAHGDYEEKWRPIWREYEASESPKCILIGRQTITFEVPDDFDPRGKQIAALEAQKREMTATFQAAVTEINRRISQLQAIEHAA